MTSGGFLFMGEREPLSGLFIFDQAIQSSVGVASFSNLISSAEALLEQADKALYRSKESGRNRVTMAEAA